MKNILKELRSQPLWVRELIFLLLVTISVSSIGLVAFNANEAKLYALIHPQEIENQQFYAEQRDKTIDESGSLFANISQLFTGAIDVVGGLTAGVVGVFVNVFDNDGENDKSNEAIEGKAYKLPLSKDR